MFRRTWLNPGERIDRDVFDINATNFKINSEILYPIVEAVITSARQRIAIQAHEQDKIDFNSQPNHNEGNFIALLRLIAKDDTTLKEHLLTGPRNAKYTSKTIQNEILDIAANQIRILYHNCLEKCSSFSIIADEVTSHGKEILSVCLRLLEIDHSNFNVKPNKLKVLLDCCYLQRITGQAIANGNLDALEKHNIEIKNCRGLANDTTASLSSSHIGVQAHIKLMAPDADYEGCCLHSLNLVICTSSRIPAIRNIMDNCQHAYLYFHNSCITRWVERHQTFSNILELYPYLLKTWDEICYPSQDKEIYPDGNNLKWDSEYAALQMGRGIHLVDSIIL